MKFYIELHNGKIIQVYKVQFYYSKNDKSDFPLIHPHFHKVFQGGFKGWVKEFMRITNAKKYIYDLNNKKYNVNRIKNLWMEE